jgi:hypothetical protein
MNLKTHVFSEILKSLSDAAKEDRERGEHVRRQLNWWNKALELRIQTQRALVISNQLPQVKAYKRKIDRNRSI